MFSVSLTVSVCQSILIIDILGSDFKMIMRHQLRKCDGAAVGSSHFYVNDVEGWTVYPEKEYFFFSKNMSDCIGAYN